MTRLTPPMRRLLDAIEAGATIRARGWQEYSVDFGPRDPRNYTAREQTFYALRNRGLVTLDKDGVHANLPVMPREAS